MKFRALRADEIECRIAMIKEKGLSLLLYKDARVDQNILDETFGMFGWKRKHEVIDGRLYCTVSIQNPHSGEWIDKQDVGTESYTEKEKGQASDSFKRACFNWGIGRELYTAPFIWIPKELCTISKSGERYVCYDSFYVKEIAYDEESGRMIKSLVIVNSKTHKIVYQLGGDVQEPSDKAALKVLTDKIAGRQEVLEKVLSLCKKEKLEDVTARQAANLLKNWDKVEAA